MTSYTEAANATGTEDMTNETTPEPNFKLCRIPLIAGDTSCIIMIIGSALGACVFVAFIVLAILCVRRRRNRKKDRVHLPNPQDIDLHPRNDEEYRPNQENSVVRELPALPTTNGGELHSQAAGSRSPPGESTQSPQPHSPNYQNVTNFLYPNDDDDDDDDDNAAHDYENNPVERKKYEEEQRRKKEKGATARIPPRVLDKKVPAHANTLQVWPSAPSTTAPKKSNSFQPSTSHGLKLSSSSGGPRDLTSPTACHSPARQGYINMSKSLENLDKRTVPQPPPLPFNPVIKVPSYERNCSPPKAHIGKSCGYVNQPA